MTEDSVELKVGEQVVVQTDEIIGTEKVFSINYSKLPEDVKKGELILLDDGKIMLEVIKTDGKKQITCKVIQGGNSLQIKELISQIQKYQCQVLQKKMSKI